MQHAFTTGGLLEPEAGDKPDGGFFCLPGEQLLLLAWLLQHKRLSNRALRAYLALIELRGERFVRSLELRREFRDWTRTKAGPPPKPLQAHYAILPELEYRTGLPQGKLAAALFELETLGLVAVSRERIAFATSVDATRGFDKEEFLRWAATYASQRRRQVPLGRRMLNYLASGAGNAKNLGAVFGVVAGLSLRAAYYYARSENPYKFAGWCRTEWLSEFVGASERTIQRIKNTWKGAGWYLPQDVPQWAMNRYGERFQINPSWGPSEANQLPAGPDCSPSAEGSPREPEESQGQGTDTPQLSPPPAGFPGPTVTPYTEEFNKESPDGTKNQDNNESHPERGENSGPDIFQSKEIQNQDLVPKGRFSAPRLSDLKPELDFTPQGAGRLLELFRQGTKCNLVGSSENDRLRWVAAAVRSMTQSDVKNPAAVFLKIVKGKLWGHLSDEDFDEANRRLKEFRFGSRGQGGSPPLSALGKSPTVPAFAPPERARLSRDAMSLQLIRNKGVRDLERAFPTLRANYGWDRARFLAALSELEGRHPPPPNAG